MTGPRRAVTRDTLGAWLLKTSPQGDGLRGHAEAGFRTIAHRCVRPGYRAALIAPGQPVMLWVSGNDPDRPAGLWAQGRTTGPADRLDPTRPPSDPRLDVPVALEPLDPPVLRDELRAHPTLRYLEVLRMPAGSNPSFLTRAELDDLRAGWPQVGAGQGDDFTG